jgi:hypothetical protein
VINHGKSAKNSKNSPAGMQGSAPLQLDTDVATIIVNIFTTANKGQQARVAMGSV